MTRLSAVDAERTRLGANRSSNDQEIERPHAAAAAPARAPIETRSADLIDFFRILRRNLWLIGLTTLAMIAIAMAYLTVTPKLYTATVSILFNAVVRPPIGSAPGALPPAPADETVVESQVKLIASDAVLRRVAIDEHLDVDPDFGPAPPGLRAKLMGMLGFKSAPSVPAAGMPVGSPIDRAVGALAHMISVKRSERTYVIDVDISARDPVKAARLANAVAQAYFGYQQAIKGDAAKSDSRVLDQRLDELQTRVADAETKVAQFKSANRINDANGKNIAEQQLGDLASQMSQARSQVAAAKARADRIRAIEAAGRLPDGTSDAMRSAGLDHLRSQYADLIRQEANLRTTLGARHPALMAVEAQMRDTERLITQELHRVSDAAGNDYQIARANETDIERRLDTARQDNDNKNQALIELSDLQRNADAARAIYEQFLRARETVSVEDASQPSARVIAPAIPPGAPSSPKKALILALATFCGVFFGSGAAILRDFASDGSVPDRTPAPRSAREDVDDEREPVLVAVPSIAKGASGSVFKRLNGWASRTRAQEIEDKDLTQFAEVQRQPASSFSTAIFDLWAGLTPSGPTHGSRRAWTVLVASISPGVGKSTIAANLAFAAAEEGARVLLIEANPENPALSPMIDPASRPGLIKVGGAERVIYTLGRRTAGTVHLVPIIPSEARIIRRIVSRSDTERFDGIAGRFDYVIMDGPSGDDEEGLRELVQSADRIALVVGSKEQRGVGRFINKFNIPRRKLGGGVVARVGEGRKAA